MKNLSMAERSGNEVGKTTGLAGAFVNSAPKAPDHCRDHIIMVNKLIYYDHRVSLLLLAATSCWAPIILTD